MSPWLHRCALLTAVATLALVGVGGLVTSHGVGMAVPDWPNTYGYNMFFFPVSQWVGGIFYEHSHRLLASGVGLLSSILAIWFYGTRARPFLRWSGVLLGLAGLAVCLKVPQRWADALVLAITGIVGLSASFFWPRSTPAPRWLRGLGLVAFFAVVLQGVLGGLRVVLIKDELGIFHATLAQLFFVLTCALALFTSQWWRKTAGDLQGPSLEPAAPAATGNRRAQDVRLRLCFIISTCLILAQLVLGASMRHQHAGLAIPDFPLAYSKLWPAIDPASIAQYNQQRLETIAVNPITAGQVILQMVHRLMAGAIFIGVCGCVWLALRRLGSRSPLARLALAWFGFLCVQILLGAATIWSNKAADLATLHVLVGALSLALGAISSIISVRALALSRHQASHVPALEALGASVAGHPAIVTSLD